MAAKKSARKKTATKRPSLKSKPLKRAIGTTPPPPPPERHRPLRPGMVDFYVVGIGASAGGLEAFEQFFSHMPAESGMAFVLVPHLSPEHKSMMAELLKRYTTMEIHEAREGMEVKPNHVYIIPPNKDLAVANNLLLLQEPTEQRGVRHPIDYFFRSLAQDQGDRSICVILSGTGTEGTIGLRAIKGEGGLVLAQDPKDAKYDGMPSSAIATGIVDHVLPASKMPELLLRYTKVAAGKLVRPLLRAEERPAEALQRIYTLIRAQTGHDFTLYKQNTVMRRIHKRMAIHQIEAIDDYVVYLRSNPHEIDILFNELLIRVTSFFRDPDAFQSLAGALPQIFGDKRDDSAVRIWVPGCSTGEEAYSLAMLCHEFQREHKGPHRKVQIFATDIDTGAIDIARAGVYPESITVDVSPERLARFFVKRSGAYKIKDEIREQVVFAVQDLIKDPPFSKLDLAACRNVLIYMGASLQKRVLALLHYALNANGILFLGSSETVGDAADMFSVIDKKWKIFRARRVEMLPVEAIELRRPLLPVERGKPGIPAAPKVPAANIGDFTERLLLERYSPPCCVVNDKGDILYIHGKTGRYLEPASGKASLNIIEMAREGMRLEVRTGLRKAVTQKKDVLYEGLQVKSNGGYKSVNLEVKYITKPEHLEGLIMVVFNEASAVVEEKGTKGKAISREKAGEKLSAMEYELKSTREHLQTTIEELETSNEELKSTNEELQSSNEELQSTNEELETSREELQSANEELLTVNTELQHKIEELSDANSDIVNLLTSTQIATLFLTYDLRIRRFTPSAIDVINIIQSDVGRPIGDISMKVNYPELPADAEEVLRNLSQKERGVRQLDGRWFLVRIVPYRTMDNVIDGVVLTFVDITQQKRAQELEENLVASLHGIVETVHHPLLVLDRDLLVVSANRAYYEMFKTSPVDTTSRRIFDLGNGGWNIPALKELLDKVLASSTPFEKYLVEHDFPQVGLKKLLLNARRIHQEGFKTDTILLAIEDVTEK